MDEKTIFERVQKMLHDEPLLTDCAHQTMDPVLPQEFDGPTPVPLSPFRIGDPVNYRVPVIDKAPWKYNWEEHRGIVQMVDPQWEMVTVIPEDEDQPWRVVPLCYAKKAGA